jgi:CDP-glucose 4,6-dehydratase
MDRRIAIVPGAIEDYDLIERALAEYEVHTVFHLAAQAIVTTANLNPRATFETNIRGTWNVLEACRRNGSVASVIVASSDKAYGAHKALPYTESHPLAGTHPYDVSKSCADLIAGAYYSTYRTPVAITRCGNMFGPGDLNFSRLVPGTIRSALMGEPPVIRSDGTPVRDYVFVEDIVDGYLRLAERMQEEKVRGKAYNFGTGEPLSVLDLTERILALAGRPDLRPQVLNQAKAEIQAQYLSSERAEAVLGWKPGRPVAERLAQTVDWYRTFLSGSAAS